uniref:Mannosyltransferase n=1 Tax=Amphimedon queenslandica TaxID=400682 RepID=A0A1X7UJ63_AMPQE
MATDDGLRKRQVHSAPLSPPKQEEPPPPTQSYSRCSNTLLSLLILYRFINALLVQTRFVPDEYFQSIESESPKIFQSLIAAASDWFIYKLTLIMFNCKETAKYALLCHIFSWFIFYCCTRTLSNTMESSLSPMILYYWIKALNTNDSISNKTMCDYTRTSLHTSLYLVLMALSVLVRPTGVILWAPFCLIHLIIIIRRGGGASGERGRRKWVEFRKTLIIMIIVIFLSLLWSILIDRFYYGKWVFVQYEFLKFNILEGRSSNFGTHPWHWYISQGFPAMLFSFLPLLVHGLYISSINSYNPLHSLSPLAAAVILLIVHSFIKHKEFRFVLPSLTLSIPYIGLSVSSLLNRNSKVIKVIVIILILINVPMSLYFSIIHQRGDVSVMKHLRQSVNSSSSVLFLLPCYSTPLYSYLHGDHQLQFLECLPDDGFPNIETEFYSSPLDWLLIHIKDPPTHIVFYDVLLSKIEEYLHNNSYVQEAKLFHTHFKDNDKTGQYILVYTS